MRVDADARNGKKKAVEMPVKGSERIGEGKSIETGVPTRVYSV